MTTHKSFGKRMTSFFLVLSMLLTMLPLVAPLTNAATAVGDRVADPSTMDSWKDYFNIYGDITSENAGSIWVDKSVFTDASAFSGTGISQNKQDSFLVALSTIAANMSMTGVSHVPTDTILVLDVSGSMSDNYSDVAKELVDAANESIATLLSTNKHNRVGVVLYSGSTTGNNYNGAAVMVLPLDRYTTGSHGNYLQYTITGSYSTTETISVNKDVRIESTKKAPPSNSKNVVGSTYIQRGIITAMEAFIAEDNEIIVEDPIMGTLRRKPVLVLMSDGSPTLGCVDFTDPAADCDWEWEYDLGDGLDSSPALGFVSQLSAAYAKAKIEEKYAAKPLFYTLGLGVSDESIAVGILDPDHPDADPEMAKLWDKYNAEGATSVKLNSYDRVQVIDTPLEQNYVDRYFSADGSTGNLAAELAKAFRDIIGTIQLQTMYSPTMVSDNDSLSGYISFVDKVGEYMEVIDVKGILIDNQLFSGADLASNFVSGGGALGTYANPTELGIEMVAAVRARLNLDSDATARTLIGLAYENGQLSYTDANNYSNYIGWYANAAGQFLGFYNEGTTVLPAPTGNADTDPYYMIKSYGYLGAVDKSHGVSETDLMYATVQVREEIATGNETVSFAVPAALIPVVSYHVYLDGDDVYEKLEVDGADSPIRLVYEVALDQQVNSFNFRDVLSPEYLENNINEDGTVNFYTSLWDYENTTEYGTENSYGYFHPSKQNDKYYYLEDTPVYTDTNGTPYTGTANPAQVGVLYRSHMVYERKSNGDLAIKALYYPLSAEEKEICFLGEDGAWYIPAGTIHANIEGLTVQKTENVSGTTSAYNVPFVDLRGHTICDIGHNYYVGATLGNSGKYILTPKSGIRLSKVMAEGAPAPAGGFTFDITNLSNPQDSATYEAYIIKADGTQQDTTVTFRNGTLAVNLKHNEVLYIGGMTLGQVFHIAERETLDYMPTITGLSESGTVTITENRLADVTFVNDNRGTGDLTITKRVVHDYGADYQIPADKVFTVQVTLTGIGTANTTFQTSAGAFTTDANGRFSFQIRHGQRITIYDLPTGTVAAVEEKNLPTGFTPAYLENGNSGDGRVTIEKLGTMLVEVFNNYTSTAVEPKITVSGTKLISGRSWQLGDSFTFLLEKRMEDGSWQQLGDLATATYGNPEFAFAHAFEGSSYAQPGIYEYRVTEVEPQNPLGGISYDKTVYCFSVHVTDVDMDGQLEISQVTSDNATVTAAADGWNVDVNFVNIYSTSGSATVTVDVNKHIENLGGGDKSLAGFNFGLFTTAGTQVGQLQQTNEQGFARFVLNYNAAEIGNGNHSYTYILKEIAPASTPKGWTYSKETVTLKVDITDNGDGTISAVIYTDSAENAGTSVSTDFTNSYNPADAQLAIDFVSKELIGRELRSGEFSFEIRLPDGTTVLRGTNNAAGKVTFDGVLTFDQVGTYLYHVVETSTDGNGIVNDKTVHRVTVTVTDADGALTARYALDAGTTVTIRNTYSAATMYHIIRGQKVLEGRTLLNDEFTFVLTDWEGNSWKVKNFADGSFEFPAMDYTAAGTYVYTVKEEIPQGGKAYGITYDTTEYTVTVVVLDDGEGQLYVDSETVSGESLRFVNTYKADPTHVQLTGDKQLTGKVNNALLGGEFAFQLYNSDASWTCGDLRETVRNGANGTVVFQEIDFDTVGTQYFLVMEQNGGQVIDGVRYDDTIYRVRVDVTDDLVGQLHATLRIYDANGAEKDSIRFLNTYEVTGGATVVISGQKYLEGRDFLSSDGFTFRLYDAENHYIVTAMDAQTHGYQFVLNYTPDQVGQVFTYVLKETNGGETINGITYSDAVYHITVSVEDDGKGGIRTNVTTDSAKLDFTNQYSAAATQVTLEGSKELTGQALEDGKFAFLLTETDANYNPLAGSVAEIVRNGADGKFAFTTMDFTTVQNRYFVVSEQDGGLTIDGITYDAAQYRIWIEVVDDLQGQLRATVHIYDANGVAKDSIRFLNTYEVTGGATVVISGQKYLEGRDFLSSDGFTFRLYDAENHYIVTAMDAQTHGYQFVLNYTPDQVGQVFTYVLKETNGGETINGITYSDAVYHITVSVEDDGKGGIRTNVTTDSAKLDFTNQYSAAATQTTVEGNKVLLGRELLEGEFKFLLTQTDATFAAVENATVLEAYNAADGKFSFSELTFTEAGTYYFLVTEDNTVAAERVTFDTAVYQLTVQVTDNLQGNLVAQVTTCKAGSDESTDIVFTNVFTPRPADITVNLGINKVVLNTGTEEITPEGFSFLLDDGVQTDMALSDAEGKAGFTLTFSEEDIGKVFRYTLSEVNCGRENVTYSAAVYTVEITVSLDAETNTLVAAMTLDGVAVDALDVTFENVYHLVIEDIPVTDDYSGMVQWLLMLLISSGAVLALLLEDRKRREQQI